MRKNNIRRSLLLLFSLAFFYSCRDTVKDTGNTGVSVRDSVGEQKKEVKQDDGFSNAYNEFITAFKAKNKEGVQSFINADKGLYVIESAGAMPAMTKLTAIEKFKTKNNKNLWDVDLKKLDCSLTWDTLPAVNCDQPSFYSMNGCFAKKTNSFKTEKIWMYCSLGKAQEKEVEQLAESIVYTVINTNHFRFYFSFAEGKWYVTFIDVRVPCNA